MPYKLISESFEIVDGPDAGKKFKRGQVYDQIPARYAGKFKEIPAAGLEKPADKPATIKPAKNREDK